MTSSRTVERVLSVYCKDTSSGSWYTGTPSGPPSTHLWVCTPTTPMTLAVAWAPVWHQAPTLLILAVARTVASGVHTCGCVPQSRR
jgi:hypothetical protein